MEWAEARADRHFSSSQSSAGDGFVRHHARPRPGQLMANVSSRWNISSDRHRRRAGRSCASPARAHQWRDGSQRQDKSLKALVEWIDHHQRQRCNYRDDRASWRAGQG